MISKIYNKIKFEAWRLSKNNVLFKFIFTNIHFILTIYFLKKFLIKLKNLTKRREPIDRYLTINNNSQFVILIDDLSKESEIISLKILLNHFRVPYQIKNINNLKNNIDINLFKYRVLIYSGRNEINLKFLKNKFIKLECLMILFKQNKFSKYKNKIFCFEENPDILINSIEGYRSNLVKKFTEILLNSNFMILTGFLPPKVSLRIDDVVGNDYKYLLDIKKLKWKANLGIFIGKYGKNLNSNKIISNLNKNQIIEISAHAISENKFLYFNYPYGCEFKKKEINKNIKFIDYFLLKYKLSLSQTINTHFHVFSEKMFRGKMSYVFSEFKPSSNYIETNLNYLPSGNPLATTGQLNRKNFIQIYSGDSASTCNLPSSNYDFLMNINKRKKIQNAFERIKGKIDLSLFTGFPCFITTHEYLILKYFKRDFDKLLFKVNKFINNHPLNPKKTSMTSIGVNCQNHTNLLLTILKIKGDKILFTIKGKPFRNFNLIGFKKNKIHELKFNEKSIGKVKILKL